MLKNDRLFSISHSISSKISGYAYLLAGAVCLVAFYQVGKQNLNNFQQSLFFFNIPDIFYTYFTHYWMIYGGLGALLSAKGLSILGLNPSALMQRYYFNEKTFIVLASLLAFLIPSLAGHFLFNNAYFTDDESAYEYSARALAQGKLYFDSPENKIFFDRAFMINDGKFYSQYFLGWPFFFAIGILLDLEHFVNPTLLALSVYPLYKISLRYLGKNWSILVIFIFLSSPSIITMAATKLSHTSCTFALLWCSYYFYRLLDAPNLSRYHFLFAAFFAIAFLIRPLSTLGLLLPLLCVWLSIAIKGRLKLRTILSFGVTSLFFSSIFFAINYYQNGLVTKVAYQRSIEYDIENDFRFSGRNKSIAPDKVANLSFKSLDSVLETVSLATIRHNFSISGWPIFLIFALLSVRRKLLLPWLMVFSYLIFHLGIDDAGFGTIAPVHFFEQSWVWIILVVSGLRTANISIKSLARNSSKICQVNIIPNLILSLVVLSYLFYVPIRLGTTIKLAQSSNFPIISANKLVKKPAIIFSPRPFVHPCISLPSRLSMFNRPVSLPSIETDVLWVNYVSDKLNSEFLSNFPNHNAYIMSWKEKSCQLNFEKLDKNLK
ncbi:glycosyltransferase family 39 protein [Aliikangiella sp. G2MR2-5]|uniref:glycosyltransferase family 39 protein n=1 Tax=Aliikangiella sp. G2MR2-5 TaxID=2788943 RepID=UPI001AEE5A16|nr:glycosyltransferase family 39 protein [Aliikangiella sp. G2MR2-5]